MYVQQHWIIINSYNQEMPWTFYFSFNVPLSRIQLQSVHVNHVSQAATVNKNYLPLIGIQFGYTLIKCGRFLVCHCNMTTQLFYEWESQLSFVSGIIPPVLAQMIYKHERSFCIVQWHTVPLYSWHLHQSTCSKL